MKKIFILIIMTCFLASLVLAVSVNAEKGKDTAGVEKGKAGEKNETDKGKGTGKNETERGKGTGKNETDKGKGTGKNETERGKDTEKNETDKGKPDKPSDKENKTSQGLENAILSMNKSLEKKINKSLEKGKPGNASIEARLQVIQKLQQKIQERGVEVDNETNNNRDKTKQFKNQNVVRERVMALLQLRNMTQDRGIGQQVAEIARNFSNSINKTQKAEEKINKRGRIRRFLFGGDPEAANEIEKNVAQNRARISQLKELRKSTSEEIGQFMDGQVVELEVEQNRLQGLAQREKKSKGIFGWLFK